ncbi:hypothetical protein V6N13_057100 [Hibiscus sabdariffa]
MEERLLAPREIKAGTSLSFVAAGGEDDLESHSSKTSNIDDIVRNDLPISLSSSPTGWVGKMVVGMSLKPMLSKSSGASVLVSAGVAKKSIEPPEAKARGVMVLPSRTIVVATCRALAIGTRIHFLHWNEDSLLALAIGSFRVRAAKPINLSNTAIGTRIHFLHPRWDITDPVFILQLGG